MASAVGELRYYSGRAVSGSLAYDLDRELRERELSHAGEMPRHREQVREQPKVRRVAKVQVRQAQKVLRTLSLKYVKTQEQIHVLQL